jgi:D-amino peptidase
VKIFISCDMEGCTGVVHGDQLVPGQPDYARGRDLMTRDVLAAATAALSVDGVRGVTVCDGHGTMRNLLLERFPVGCEVVCGPASSKTLCQSEGLDGTYAALLLVGFHAKAGTRDAVLPHTWIGSLVHEIRVNDRVFGEAALNAAIAGAFGVPTVFLTGDEAACREVRADVSPQVVTVATKRATGPRAAICKPPAQTEADIRIGVLTALQELKQFQPFVVEGPVEFAVVFHQVAQADRASKHPSVERTGDREVRFRRPAYLDAVRLAWQVCEWTASENPEWLR